LGTFNVFLSVAGKRTPIENRYSPAPCNPTRCRLSGT